ncbi:MAG TPA: hypothetical protein PL000_19115 [Anaerolineales bacterium]|nr:hypothetical protein [Anaerolineales bacterium]
MNAIKGSCENCGAGFHRVADSGDALMIDGVYHQEYIWCKLHPKPVAKSKHDFCFQWREQEIDERKVAP